MQHGEASKNQAGPSALSVALGAAFVGLTLWRAGTSSSGGRSVRDTGEAAHSRNNNASGSAAADRGRTADSPAEIPPRGWWDVLKRTATQISEDRVLAVAAGVTFYGLLAIFPAITAFVSLYGLVADPVTLRDHLNMLSGVMPGGGMEIISEQLTRLTSQPQGALGFGFIVGLAVALWSANAGIKAVFDALNIAYGESEKRGFIALNLLSLTFTAGMILFLILGISMIVVVPIVLNWFGLGGTSENLVAMLRWPAMFIIATFAFSLLYRYGPSRDHPQWRWITPGSFVGAALWIGGSLAFSWYVSNFGSYNETYGSLGAAIGFMTWLWLSSTILLAGAELNAEAEHQTVKDSTTGKPAPMGRRGAAVADEVAP
jgi:membrane protein